MVWISYYWQQVSAPCQVGFLYGVIIKLAMQMLQAVHVIHEEKIIHSDLKPANFVLVRGQLKLIDFGIANAIANDTTNIQRDHQVCTPSAAGDDFRLCWETDRHGELHESRSYRAPGWYAAPQSRSTLRCLVPWLHTLPNGVRAPTFPTPLRLPKDESHPGPNAHYRFSTIFHSVYTDSIIRVDHSSQKVGSLEEKGKRGCNYEYEELSVSESEGEGHNP